MTITNYSIKQPIGQGGMATVFLAEDNKFDTQVAIKVLNKELSHNDNIRKRFLAEAKNMFRMSHPNIIKVTDLIDDGDTVAFVMEYIEGETLKEYLERKGKLSDEEIKTIFSQMLDAVGYVHEQKLVHRDIKPSNFMITQKGQVKLLDFGIAKNTDTQSADYTQTGTSQNMGTPMYMSPEQIKSTKDVTLQSDIYSLGVVLWQMVMGKKPYDTNTTSTFELQTKIVNEKLSLTNSPFDTVIGVATEKEVSKRFKNCKALKEKWDNLQKQDHDNSKTYTKQDSEKTIVDNSSEKTVVETQEINNYTPKSQINIPDIPPKNYNNSNVGYIVLGIIVLIILGVIISNNNHSNTTENFDIPVDSAAVAVDTAASVTDYNKADANYLTPDQKMLIGNKTFGHQFIDAYGVASIRFENNALKINGEQRRGEEYCTISGIIDVIDDRNFYFTGTISVKQFQKTFINNEYVDVVEDKTLNDKFLFRRTGDRQYWRLKQSEKSTTGFFDFAWYDIDIFMN